MANVLYLAHRIPYPPDKGDKIATFNFLRHLARGNRVHLGAFVDDEADWQHAAKVREYCADLKLVGIRPLPRKLWSARGLLTGQSFTELYYRSADMQRWVDRVCADAQIDAVFAYCSAVAPYAASARWRQAARLAHFTDVDSEKWRSYAQGKSGLARWLYAREGERLLALERRMSALYDTTSFISDAEVALFARLAPEASGRLRVIPNGVDTDYFDPDLPHENPYPAATPSIVFTGAMDYWPNADAVSWFAHEVLGQVRAALPTAEFWIVGSKPTPEVQALATLAGVRVTGRVPDVRPYVAHAGAVVAPLRIARGTQNKVLEAYAMARDVALTSAAANGLRPAPFIAAATHDEPAALAGQVLRMLRNPPRSDTARRYVMDEFSWAHAFSLLDQGLRLDATGDRPAAGRR